MSNKLTVISHFYNEELLLPHWLKHHREIANHGILINYASTDNSVDIIHDLCPTWEVRDSRNKYFFVLDTTNEVMDIEETISGWKTVLTITEFVFLDPTQLDKGVSKAFIPERTYTMVDVEPGTFDSNGSLLEQKHHGIKSGVRIARAIHCHSRGGYSVGRHAVGFPVVKLEGSYLLKYALSPWPEVLPRKLQIQNKITPENKVERLSKGEGWQHFMTEMEMIHKYRERVQKAVDIYDSLGLPTAAVPC